MADSIVSYLMEWYSEVVVRSPKELYRIYIAEENIKDDLSCKVQGLL